MQAQGKAGVETAQVQAQVKQGHKPHKFKHRCWQGDQTTQAPVQAPAGVPTTQHKHRCRQEYNRSKSSAGASRGTNKTSSHTCPSRSRSSKISRKGAGRRKIQHKHRDKHRRRPSKSTNQHSLEGPVLYNGSNVKT